MSNVVIYGGGQMGTPIAWAMKELEHSVTVFDKSVEAFGIQGVTAVAQDASDFASHLLDCKPDIVISALPFYLNDRLADFCIENGIAYCDLGGDRKTTSKIRDHALKHASAFVFSDLGLAPGWVNIEAENLYQESKDWCDSVYMYVGGIPTDLDTTQAPLHYNLNWSVEGLVNEYYGNVEILKDYKRNSAKALDGSQHIEVCGNFLEAFYTNGGSAHSVSDMIKYGLKNFSYKTLRWPGHRMIVKALRDDGEYTVEDMKEYFEYHCPPKPKKDSVFWVVQTKGGGRESRIEKRVDASPRFTAMQRSTAFGCASVAQFMLKHPYKMGAKILSYRDILYTSFSTVLSDLMLLDEHTHA